MYSKILTYVKLKYQEFTEKVNKGLRIDRSRNRSRNRSREKYPKFLQSAPPQVIALKKFIEDGLFDEKNVKKVSLEKTATGPTGQDNSEKILFSKFVTYILANGEGLNLPTGKEIENYLSIGSTKRKELAKKACEAGVLIPGSVGKGYIINPDYNSFDLDFSEFE